MHNHTPSTRRFTARLGLESLESRTLPSATLPAAASTATATVHQADAMQVDHLASASAQSQAAVASFSYRWNVGPSTVLTGTNHDTANGHSTGCVMVATYRPGHASVLAGSSVNPLPVAVVTSSSSASDSRPDTYNTPFSITLTLKDSKTGISGTITFKGTITGTLSWDHSTLKLTFQGPLTKHITLGKHVYTLTLKTGSLAVPVPGSTPAQIAASLKVSNA
jgi:hypothetical protein